MPSYRFARRPAWIASHVFVLLCVVAFVRLGVWQLARHDERQQQNAVTEARMAASPAPLGSLLAGRLDGGPDVVLRRATVTGHYRPDEQVLVRNRTNNEAPGFWVVTPLVTVDGTGVLVNRGWIPLTAGDGGDPARYGPPAGVVTVTGMVRASQVREGLGSEDPPDGRLAVVSRIDVPRIARQVDVPLAGVYLDLISQEPASSTDLPVPVPPPDLTAGSHLSYAVQWFTFAALTVVVYALILRRQARRRVEVGDDDADRDPRPGEDEPVVLLGPRR